MTIFLDVPSLEKLKGKRRRLQNLTPVRGASPGISYKLQIENGKGGRRCIIATQEWKICDMENENFVSRQWKCAIDRFSQSTQVNLGKQQK